MFPGKKRHKWTAVLWNIPRCFIFHRKHLHKMKRINHALLTMLISYSAVAQNDMLVESRISHVTVFLDKAQVTREIKTRISEGETNLVLSGLAAQLDPNSIQVAAKGNFTMLGFHHQQNFLRDMATPARIKMLQDSLSLLQDKITFENMEKEILNKEEQMLISNQKIGGANQNLPVNELKTMAEFFRARLHDIAVARLRRDNNVKTLNESMAKVQKQIQAQNELTSRNTSELVIRVSAKSTTEADLVVDYIVGNASWSPLYDLRAANTREPISLFYKANVVQRTGENWNNVRLTLSTGNPSVGAVKPELQPWRLEFYNPDYYRAVKKAAGRQAAPTAAPSEVSAAEAETIADFVTVEQTAVNTQFEISLPYTVASAAKPTTVDIGRHELKAAYRYAVTPKLDPDAFLIAASTGWGDLNLLPGEANIFFQGTFVGKTFLDPEVIKDTLSISMGRDKRIVVNREKVKNFNSHAVIGLNQKQEYAFEINVRNNQSQPVSITVEDQIPVSGNSDIEVSLSDAGGAKFTPVDGKLVWQLTLKPNESRKIAYRFEVKFPKDKLIAGLN
jgi:uncharacterized protein (TIGR02231 family)